MISMRKYARIALAMVVVATLGACDDPTGDDAGTVSLLLTDAPGDFAKAVVTIDRIELARDDDSEVEGDDGEGGAVVLMDTPYTGDLLQLANDVATLVDEAVVPGGSYSQLRFVISGGCIEVETETGSEVYASSGYTECGAADGSLHMPSFAQSGLKVTLPGGFQVAGDQNVLLVDFDVSQSFGRQAGASGMWVMEPVVIATEVQLTGSIDVSVTLADTVDLPGDVAVDSFDVQIGEEPAIDIVDGSATFRFLVPGTYSVRLIAPEGVSVTTDPVLPADVDVGSGEVEELEVTITGAS